MGSKTFESIGKPLKNRYNIVITKNPEKYRHWQEKNITFTANWKEILGPYEKNPHRHIFIIGGREIYQQTYFSADYYYVSIVKGDYEGNIYFPFADLRESKEQKKILLEELFKDFELIKKEEFPDFTAYIYKKT
jgi:dihydrofolate reductase